MITGLREQQITLRLHSGAQTSQTKGWKGPPSTRPPGRPGEATEAGVL